MLKYGLSIRGKSHISSGAICQDANVATEILAGVYLAVAADGVGSALHSDIASNIAVEKLEEYVRKHLQMNTSIAERKECLRAGYEYAENAIEDYVQRCGDNIRDYDTTLHAVLYDGRTVVYGHSGDGGIIVRTIKGRTHAITTPQKGSDGVSVMPLRAGRGFWEFDSYPDAVSAVLLTTDGILDRVMMPYLLNLPTTRGDMQNVHRKKENVYLSATEFFMNPYCVLGNHKIKDPIDVYRYFLTGEFSDPEADWQTYLSCLNAGYRNLYGKEKATTICNSLTASVPLWNLEDTTDDKTVVCLINEEAPVYPQDLFYFMEPDWASLRSHYEQLMYPTKGEVNMPNNVTGKDDDPPPETDTKKKHWSIFRH